MGKSYTLSRVEAGVDGSCVICFFQQRGSKLSDLPIFLDLAAATMSRGIVGLGLGTKRVQRKKGRM